MLPRLPRRAALAAAASLALPWTLVRAQSDYPNKTVRVIVPLSAGAGSDIATRIVTDALGKVTGQSFVVDNRPGGAGNIGAAMGAKATPDGYTLVSGGLGITVVNQFMYTREQMGFDPVADLTPISLLAKAPFALAARPGFGPNNIQELVAAAKAKPRSIDVAITSAACRLAFELFQKSTDTALFPVQYKTFGQAATDTASGVVALSLDTVAALRPFLSNGRLKALGVTTRQASPLAPGVPSFAEQGVPDYEVVGYISLYGPRGMSREQAAFLSREIDKILRQPDTVKRLGDLGFEPGGGTPQFLADMEQQQRALWGPIIKAANMTPG
jgi:tripartite-type tricarboxylate transporter receptor subunit TctC